MGNLINRVKINKHRAAAITITGDHDNYDNYEKGCGGYEDLRETDNIDKYSDINEKSVSTYHYILNDDNGNSIGTALCSRELTDKKIKLENIQIDEKYRCRGYGYKLIRRIENDFKDFVIYGRIEQNTNVAKLKKWYSSLGYKIEKNHGEILITKKL